MALAQFGVDGSASASTMTIDGAPWVKVGNLSNKTIEFTVTGRTETFILGAGEALLVDSVGAVGSKTVSAQMRHMIGNPESDFGLRGFISVTSENNNSAYSIPNRYIKGQH